VETLTYSSGRASGCDSPGLLNRPLKMGDTAGWRPWRTIHRAAAGLQPAVCEGPERRTEVHRGTLKRNVIYLRTKAKHDDRKRRN
jgi:hypothetical protein